MKKKYISLLLMLVMVFTILPDTSATVKAAGEPSTKITSRLSFSGDDSQDCTNTTKHTHHTHADGRKCWTWDQDNATLTLDGVDIEVSGAESAISFEGSGDTKLVLKGNNTISHKNGTFSSVNTIYARYGLEISGTGAVTINASDKTGSDIRAISSGIYTGGKLRITSGSVTAVSGAVSTTGTVYYTGSESYGLWGYGGVEITGGTVNATGGYVESVNYGVSHGICNGTSAGIHLSGGTVTAQAMNGHKPFDRNPTLTNMRHKAGTGTWDNTTGTACTYEPTPPFVAVGDITMTNAVSVQTNTDLTLVGTVTPSDATNNGIAWSVQNAGDTGATVSGSTFRATAAGTATIRATVTDGSGTGSDYTKDFTITVSTPPISGGGSGGFSGGTSTPVKIEGKIEKDQKLDENAPTADLKDSTEELKAKVFSDAEQEQIAAGKNAKVILKVQDISSSVSAEDKKRIEEKLMAEQQGLAHPALLYVDISLYKQIGDEQETRITQTSGKIKISIEVPESMWSTDTGANRTYRVVRVHDGVTEILEGIYDPATHLFTFETDRFSTYALTYRDGNTTSGQNSGDTSKQFTTAKDFNHLRLTAKADSTSQKLSYAKVTGADGYLIYGAQYGKKLKKLADVDEKVRSYTVKKLKKGTYYTYQVKAYKVIDGKKVILAESSPIHSVTTSKTYGNPTKIVIKESSITLTAGTTKKVTYQVVLPENKKMKAFAGTTYFETTNQEIAIISKNGRIIAKEKGACYVYVYAQNGVYKKIKLIVE